MQIKTLDVLYDEQVCNLVYMQDISTVYKEEERSKTLDNILMANAYTSKELQGPQQTILTMSNYLIQNCEEKHREMLETIKFCTKIMHLHVSNLVNFQLLKYDAFVVQEKILNTVDEIKDAVRTLSVAACLSNI